MRHFLQSLSGGFGVLSRPLVELCDGLLEGSELKDNNAALERAIDYLEAAYLSTVN